MAWETTVLFVRDVPIERLLGIVADFQRTRQLVEFERAFTGDISGAFAVGTVGDWTVFWDPSGQFARSERLQYQLAWPGPVLAAVLSRGNETYGIWWYERGALRRKVLYTRGQAGDVLGEPLVDEIHGADEEWALAMLQQLTGLGLRELEEAMWERLER